MEIVLQALNDLVLRGILGDYAIGGAVGAAFYIEAVQTEDVDAFVFLPGKSSGLVMLSSVYEALQAAGGVIDREFIRFGNWPLQILTDANPLIAEAIQKAVGVTFHATPTRVFTAEHLCAIAIQTGRSKDALRVTMFLEQGAVDLAKLDALLTRFNLREKAKKLLPAAFGE